MRVTALTAIAVYVRRFNLSNDSLGTHVVDILNAVLKTELLQGYFLSKRSVIIARI